MMNADADTATQATPAQAPPLGFFDSRAWGAILLAAHGILAMGPLAWLLADGLREGGLLIHAGQGAGLSGLALLCLQVILAGRFRLLERPFGYDRVVRFHKAMALAALMLLVAHPLLIAAAYDYWALLGLKTTPQIWVGKAALILAVGVVVAPAMHYVLRIDYQVWRVAHKGAIAVVALGAVHGFLVGAHLQSGPMRIWVGGLVLAALAVFVWRNAMAPFVARRRMRVEAVRRETHDVWTLDLAPVSGALPSWRPGQFMFLKLHRPGRGSEEHPFTIASAPGEALRATIKESGNYTRTIGRTREGDQAGIEAPFGRFSYVYRQPRRILLIAGGAGITPMMSMIRCLREAGDERQVVLIDANRTEGDIVFREELAALPPNFEVAHVLSEPSASWQGACGFVDAEAIRAAVAEDFLAQAHCYVCGPPAMMRGVVRALRSLGVASSRIHYELFGL